MRLVNTRSFNLVDFSGSAIPKYAILSHTWGEGKVSFQEWDDKDLAAKKAGYKKIIAACKQAQADNLEYLWVDTNCIDKNSSAELSEAVNSMFVWYARSDRCYVYLADFVQTPSSNAEIAEPAVSSGLATSSEPLDIEQLRQCRWFTRGWTLQELLAPKTVIFFDLNWQRFGEKGDEKFRTQLSEITGIDAECLENRHSIFTASVSARMSWAASRRAAGEEDIAYCLLGIFGINMPLLYGEGRRAFLRLQEEIIRISNDQTIFCWSYPNEARVGEAWDSVLAPHPCVFAGGGTYIPNPYRSIGYSLTNNGLEIPLDIIEIDNDYSVAYLAAVTVNGNQLALILRRSGDMQCRNPRDRLRSIPFNRYDAQRFRHQQFRLKYRTTPTWAESETLWPLQQPHSSLVLLPFDDKVFVFS
ncbi:heterokaryon incompatibility protein-domain-containing protein [Xylaria acuta]|nr:heterokaryon incompatibility protein-domain-containing protein [Xylaria acuta]